jgi:hypothetical protein
MGVTFPKLRLSDPRRPRKRVLETEGLVDTGAVYGVPSR